MTQDHAIPTSSDSMESMFETTMRGFNKRQVEDYVIWSKSELQTAQAETQKHKAQVDEHQREVARLRDELTQMRSDQQVARPAHEEVSERLAQILRLADEEADQKRAKAAGDAEATLEAAREQSAKVLEAAKSAAEGIISAARERAEKEAAAAKAEAEALLENASTSSQSTIADAEARAAAVLADADRRTASITALQDERLAGLRDVHTDTLRRLEAVRGVLEKVLTAEADAGPPDNGVAPAPLPVAGEALRATDVKVSASGIASGPAPSAAHPSAPLPLPVDHSMRGGFDSETDGLSDGLSTGDPLLSDDYVESVLADDPADDDELSTRRR